MGWRDDSSSEDEALNDDSLDARLARIEERLRNLSADVAELTLVLNGPNGSIRGRLHKLENEAAAAKAAGAALDALRHQQGEGFSRKQQVALLLFGAVASLGTIVSVVVAVSQLGG